MSDRIFFVTKVLRRDIQSFQSREIKEPVGSKVNRFSKEQSTVWQQKMFYGKARPPKGKCNSQICLNIRNSSPDLATLDPIYNLEIRILCLYNFLSIKLESVYSVLHPLICLSTVTRAVSNKNCKLSKMWSSASKYGKLRNQGVESGIQRIPTRFTLPKLTLTDCSNRSLGLDSLGYGHKI